MAIFSIFRHTAEQPLYAIAKVPGAAQGGYMVYNGPRKLAHGKSLEDVCASSIAAAASAGLSYLLGVVAAPMPAPTAAPTSTGATAASQPVRRIGQTRTGADAATRQSSLAPGIAAGGKRQCQR